GLGGQEQQAEGNQHYAGRAAPAGSMLAVPVLVGPVRTGAGWAGIGPTSGVGSHGTARLGLGALRWLVCRGGWPRPGRAPKVGILRHDYPEDAIHGQGESGRDDGGYY